LKEAAMTPDENRLSEEFAKKTFKENERKIQSDLLRLAAFFLGLSESMHKEGLLGIEDRLNEFCSPPPDETIKTDDIVAKGVKSVVNGWRVSHVKRQIETEAEFERIRAKVVLVAMLAIKAGKKTEQVFAEMLMAMPRKYRLAVRKELAKTL
jgi:flagellar motor component MotA